MVQVPQPPPAAMEPEPAVDNGAEESKVEEDLLVVASSTVNGKSNGTTTTTTMAAPGSPMKAAADLIQTLDIAYSEMTTCAADAAKDAEAARRNARAASEIARRYLNRSYPKVHSSFGAFDSTEPSSHKTASPTRTTQNRLFPVQATEYEGETKEGESISLTVRPGGGRGIGDALYPMTESTPRYNSNNHNSSNFLTSSPSRSRSTRVYPTPSSTERIAQSHAEDVLALSMELERTKQALKSETRMLEEAKSDAANLKAKSNYLEDQNEKLQKQIEQLKREKEERTSEFEVNLRRATLRVQAAEEDAQVALDLAKESAEKRDEMEEKLDDAKEELRVFKEQQMAAAIGTPRRTVRFADETPPPPPPPPPPPADTIPTTPTRTTPSRSMVAAGRQLLRRANAASPQDEVITLELTPAKSAERRRKLRDRLTQYEEEEAAMTLFPVAFPRANGDGVLATGNGTMILRSPARGTGIGSGAAMPGTELADCQNAAKLLQESGERLELGGHWWRNKGASRNKLVHEMEAMTRHYCQSVEFKIGRQKKEIDELESLCGFLEQKLVTGSGSSMEE